MKRAIFSVMTVFVLIGLAGCVTQHGRRPIECMGGSCAQSPETCQSCDQGDVGCCESGDDCYGRSGRMVRCRRCNDRGCEQCCEAPHCGNPGPPTGGVAYPYYTVRGPRDFLADNPPSIGPQ